MTITHPHPSLQRVLTKTGLDMNDIALLLEVSMTTLVRWAKHGISKAGANKLGKLLNLDPNWVLTGEHGSSASQSTPKQHKLLTKEAMLEFVSQDDGTFALKEVGSGEVWVRIDFAQALQEMVGKETLHMVGHHMIQAGIASFMEKQMRQYHAHVYDETPKHFS